MAIYNKTIPYRKEDLLKHYKRRESLADLIYGILRFIVIVVENIYCISSYFVLTWIIFFPISWVRSDIFSRLENYLYNSLLFIVSSWSLASGASIVEIGDDYRHLLDDSPIALQNGTPGAGDGPNTISNCYDIKLKKCPMNGDSASAHNGSIKNRVINSERENCSGAKGINGGFTVDQLQEEDTGTLTKCDGPTPEGLDQSVDHSTPQLTNSWLPSVTEGVDKQPRILLLCNHISTADVPLMMQSFSTLTKQSLLWVLDAQFKPTNFGLVCSSHGDFFIAKNSFTDGSLRDQVLKHPDRNILVLFPEGGFWRKRLEGSNRYALKNGLPMTKYVTHPRFGAFKDLIDPSVNVTHIVDATLLYDDLRDPLSIMNIALGNRKEPALLHYKIYKRSEINPTEEWLRNLWLEKDKLLQKYYEDRDSFYHEFEATMRTAKLDWVKVLTVHLFYLGVCYLTVYRLFNATGITMLKAKDLYYSNI